MKDKNPPLFHERQRLQSWLLWLFGVDTIMIAGILFLIRWKVAPESFPFVWIAFVLAIPAAVGILFLFCKLETQVRRDAVYVRLFPLHLRSKKFTWEEIDKYYARSYNPLLEYGGWGIRWTFSNGKAYNIRGNHGLQIVFKNGKKLLIGSQKPDELAAAMDQAMKRSDQRSSK